MINENIDYGKTFTNVYSKLDKFKKPSERVMYKVLVFDVKARQVSMFAWFFVGFSRN